MFKKGILYLLAFFTISLIVNQTILSKEEKPVVQFELADKTIPYKIANYSWGKLLDKDKLVNVSDQNIKEDAAIPAFHGDLIKIHFSKQPENIEVLERTATKNSYIYNQNLDSKGSYSFALGSRKGERVYEVKGIWKGNNYFTYLIKVKII
ncbi:hypothetical protein CN692_00550 [Bacillus sp. AFS002410]|uniref:hypothetical protein n=1 Tax=Bacillus sp. AFS002410 TaxID=2033481 RepID=UPI000BF0ED6B|nr:hypothetical protein [Bacillus sp. AFS002410]PEJ60614.1 hypothetical protein CN692_00550 [Bacillus sp. AFS002410]